MIPAILRFLGGHVGVIAHNLIAGVDLDQTALKGPSAPGLDQKGWGRHHTGLRRCILYHRYTARILARLTKRRPAREHTFGAPWDI